MTATFKHSGGIALGPLATPPSNPENGFLYYDSSLGKFQMYVSGAFQAMPDQTVIDALMGADIAYGISDGSKKNIQASSDDLDSAINDLDIAIGDLDATPTNYTPVDAAVVASHLAAIDAALATAGSFSFSDADFELYKDADATAKAVFDLSAIGASATRTITMPNSNVNLGLIATAIQSSEKGSANGVAPLNGSSKIDATYLPSYVDDVLEYANFAALPGTGETGKIYVTLDDNKGYRWTGSVYLEVSPSDVNSVNGQTGVVVLTTTNIAEGTNLYYTAARFNTAFSGKSTSDLAEGSNLYFTDARAKSAAVTDAINDGVTDVAPSQNAVYDALALKLSSVSQDTTPSLGGNLTLGNNVLLEGSNGLRRGGASAFVEEQYFDSISLSASQTNTTISSLTFAHASFEGFEMVYKIKEATSNDIRIGTFKVVTNGSAISYADTYNETASTGVTLSATISGSDILIQYSSGSNGASMKVDVKRIKA